MKVRHRRCMIQMVGNNGAVSEASSGYSLDGTQRERSGEYSLNCSRAAHLVDTSGYPLDRSRGGDPVQFNWIPRTATYPVILPLDHASNRIILHFLRLSTSHGALPVDFHWIADAGCLT